VWDQILCTRVRHENENKRKKNIMQTTTAKIHDPAKAKAYFENKLAFTTGPVEVNNWLRTDHNTINVVDVREAEDYAKGHIPGAINLPRDRWNSLEGLQRDKTNVVYCYTQTCHLAANACATFAGKGYPVMELEGGFEGWKDNDLDIEPASANRLRGTAEQAGRR
jgi:rhodanese-related sulfurtransferase